MSVFGEEEDDDLDFLFDLMNDLMLSGGDYGPSWPPPVELGPIGKEALG